jgi:hypothetical protein
MMTQMFMTFVAGWVAGGGEAGAVEAVVRAFNAHAETQFTTEGDCVNVWVVDHDGFTVATFDGVDRTWHEC